MAIHKLKNAGAWYRTNKLCKKHPDLVAMIHANADANTAFNDMLEIIDEIATDAGVSGAPEQPAIMPCPLAFWQGRLSFDSFTKDASGRYIGDHAQDFREKAEKFRTAVRTVIDALSMRNDMFQVGPPDLNPGGVAGAEIGV